jgi:hypothetical protein
MVGAQLCHQLPVRIILTFLKLAQRFTKIKLQIE